MCGPDTLIHFAASRLCFQNAYNITGDFDTTPIFVKHKSSGLLLQSPHVWLRIQVPKSLRPLTEEILTLGT